MTFTVTIESVRSSSLDVHSNPNASTYPTLVVAADVHAKPHGTYPTLSVAGRTVKTDGSTRFKWSDGTSLDPYAIVTGDQAQIEGWSQPEGYVLAAKVVVTKR